MTRVATVAFALMTVLAVPAFAQGPAAPATAAKPVTTKPMAPGAMSATEANKPGTHTVAPVAHTAVPESKAAPIAAKTADPAKKPVATATAPTATSAPVTRTP